MAKQVEQQNVIETQCAGPAKQAEKKKKKNRKIILKVMSSIIYSLIRIVFQTQSYTRS